jgi:hypothetical protein
VCACGFILAGLGTDTAGAIVYLVSCVLGAAWYALRRRTLRRRGLSIEELILSHAAHVVRPPAAAGAALPSRA